MLDSIVIKTPEEIEDDLWDELDAYHEKLGLEDQKLLENNLNDGDEANTAGIYIQLANGDQTVAQINPDVMNRMLGVISMDEFNGFVETIVIVLKRRMILQYVERNNATRCYSLRTYF